jgi:hypothetical protein
MIAEYNRNGRVLVIFGFLLFIGSFLLAIALPNFVRAYTQVHHGARPQWVVCMEWITPSRLGDVGFVAAILFIIGLGFLAKAKGYGGVFGLFVFSLFICFLLRAKGYGSILRLFVFLFFIGLLILPLLPDRTKEKE